MSDTLSGQIQVINAIGMRFNVDVSSEQDAFTKMRALGRNGWSPIDVPAGGFRFPLALHEKFDWSLIGAYPLAIDDEPGVMFQGQFYKRREYEEQTKGKKMPAAIKYSRGAHPTDDPRIVEGEQSSSFKYVTLAMFRGNGKSIARFELPSNGTTAKPAATRPSEPEPRGEHLADLQASGVVPMPDTLNGQQISAIQNLIRIHRLPEKLIHGVVLSVTGNRTADYAKARPDEGAQIIKQLQHVKAGVA